MDIESNQELQKKSKVLVDKPKRQLWLGLYTILLFVCILLYVGIRSDLVFVGEQNPFFLRLSLAVAGVILILFLTKLIELVLSRNQQARKQRYNILRLVRFISILFVLFVGVSFIFEKWYAAAVSLGLFSLILGFALQTPISSLIGWFYIIIRTPYRIGDRIQVSDFTGDVVEISYLDTTLWEFHGDYLSNDVPSGRLIRFPNTLVLQSEVYNYSWKKFPVIWNEIPFYIAYESDLEYVELVTRETAKKVLGTGMAENIEQFKMLLKETPVDDLEIKDYPFVVFRTNANTWAEVSLTYLVQPKKASAVRSQLIKEIASNLLKQPEKVMFPKGNAR